MSDKVHELIATYNEMSAKQKDAFRACCVAAAYALEHNGFTLFAFGSHKPKQITVQAMPPGHWTSIQGVKTKTVQALERRGLIHEPLEWTLTLGGALLAYELEGEIFDKAVYVDTKRIYRELSEDAIDGFLEWVEQSVLPEFKDTV